MMRAATLAAFALLSTHTLSAQGTSLWLDASGAHSRPPAGAGDVATQGVIGARLHAARRSSSFELAASYGRSAEATAGSWATVRGGYDASRVNGIFDVGIRADANGLTYLTPVDIGNGSDYAQTLLSGSVRPHAGVSVASFRIGLEGTLTGGGWRSEVTTPVTGGGPFPSLPGSDNIDSRTVSDEGALSVIGGAATLLRVFGAASMQLRAGSYEAENQIASGRYSGVDATLGVNAGALDLTFGARRWTAPDRTAEVGGHAGAGLAMGESAYVQAVVSRTVADPMYGAAGSFALNAGVSVRVGGGRSAEGSIARVGAASGGGRVVTFMLKHAGARSVSVAGDFSGWEPRTLTRTGSVWKLATMLEPGVYHFSFIIDGDTWMVPDDAPGIIDDGFGRKNATLIVNASGGQVVP